MPHIHSHRAPYFAPHEHYLHRPYCLLPATPASCPPLLPSYLPLCPLTCPCSGRGPPTARCSVTGSPLPPLASASAVASATAPGQTPVWRWDPHTLLLGPTPPATAAASTPFDTGSGGAGRVRGRGGACQVIRVGGHHVQQQQQQAAGGDAAAGGACGHLLTRLGLLGSSGSGGGSGSSRAGVGAGAGGEGGGRGVATAVGGAAAGSCWRGDMSRVPLCLERCVQVRRVGSSRAGGQ